MEAIQEKRTRRTRSPTIRGNGLRTYCLPSPVCDFYSQATLVVLIRPTRVSIFLEAWIKRAVAKNLVTFRPRFDRFVLFRASCLGASTNVASTIEPFLTRRPCRVRKELNLSKRGCTNSWAFRCSLNFQIVLQSGTSAAMFMSKKKRKEVRLYISILSDSSDKL